MTPTTITTDAMMDSRLENIPHKQAMGVMGSAPASALLGEASVTSPHRFSTSNRIISCRRRVFKAPEGESYHPSATRPTLPRHWALGFFFLSLVVFHKEQVPAWRREAFFFGRGRRF